MKSQTSKTKAPKSTKAARARKPSGLFIWIGNYKKQIALLCLFVLAVSALNLAVPKIIAAAIDDFTNGKFVFTNFLFQFAGVALLMFIISTGQGVFSALIAEKAAFDLRESIAGKIARQSYNFINQKSPATLLTNLTSDVDAVKTIIAQAIPILFSSILLIVGSAIILITINWQLALIILGVIALLMLFFQLLFRRAAGLFKMAQEALDKLNKTINESILASALIRVVSGQYREMHKFHLAAAGAQEINFKILSFFASLVPMITFFANISVLVVSYVGGSQVINNTLSLGQFTAFYNYISILIMPVIMLGFISNLMVRASTSYNRIAEVLEAPLEKNKGTLDQPFEKNLEAKKINLTIRQKEVLFDISFTIKRGQKTALIGPTGAGKTLLLYLLSGLMKPTSGKIMLDGKPLAAYDADFLQKTMALVFQDNIIFNGTIRENICFYSKVSEKVIQKAISTAALDEFVKNLPDGLDHMITERGQSLSGGQKQRLSLARALILEPQILLLDDFTARVDINTEKLILSRLQKNYPDLTLITVSQKISTVKDFDHLILMMEGELLAQGTHEELLKKSFEYRQIFSSQQTA